MHFKVKRIKIKQEKLFDPRTSGVGYTKLLTLNLLALYIEGESFSLSPGTSYSALPWCFFMLTGIFAPYPASKMIPPNYLTDHEKTLSFSLSENGYFIFPRLDPTMENVLTK